jgi:hypothetical protein
LARSYNFFRLKKKSHRQTGSRFWGGVGEVIFFASLALLSLILLAAISTIQGQALSQGRPGFHWWVFALQWIALGFSLVTGCYRVAYIFWTFGASAERRSEMLRRGKQIKVISDTLPRRHNFPGVPDDGHITNSPGTKLRFRLPIVQKPSHSLLVGFAVWVVLVIAATSLVVSVWDSLSASRLDFLVISLSLIFLVVAAWSTYHLLTQVLREMALGVTLIEVSDHPLIPGKSYEIYISQHGRLMIKSLQISVICSEEATFQQGTDVRRECLTVRNISVCQESNIEVDPDHPFEKFEKLVIPEDSMHSFQSRSNAISWSLYAKALVDGWPEVERQFRIVVFPPSS